MRPGLLISLGVVVVSGAGVYLARTHSANRSREQALGFLKLLRQGEETDYQGEAIAKLQSGAMRQVARVRIYYKHPHQRLLVFDSQFQIGCNGHRDWMYDPRTKTASYTNCRAPALEALWNRDFGLLLQNYQIEATGRVRIAGRDCLALEVKPRHPGRSHIRLKVDRDTGVVLAQEQERHGGRPLSQSRMTRIDYSPDFTGIEFDPPVLAEAPRGPEPMDRGQIARRMGFPVILPDIIPVGFRIEGYALYRCACCPNCGLRAAMITLTDGVDHINIFETRPPFLGCSQPKDGSRARSGIIEGSEMFRFGGGTMARLVQDNHHITVVGSLPPDDLYQIAQSVRIP